MRSANARGTPASSSFLSRLAVREDLALVVAIVDEVHGGAGGRDTAREHRGVHVLAEHAGATEARQRCGMDVDRAPAIRRDDAGIEQLHPTREHDDVDVVRGEEREHGGAGIVVGLAAHVARRDVVLARPRERARGRVVRHHDGDGGVQLPRRDGAVQRDEVAAATGREHREAQGFVHAGSFADAAAAWKMRGGAPYTLVTWPTKRNAGAPPRCCACGETGAWRSAPTGKSRSATPS
jgi:hypothetical protein